MSMYDSLVATTSYLEEAAGGMVTAAAFDDDDAAANAVAMLRQAGVREQDISVIARDRSRAEEIAESRAWVPLKEWRGALTRLLAIVTGGLPSEIRRRYGKALRDGKVVVAVAAGTQPPDTIAVLLAQAHGDLVDSWWQSPTTLFAPPELAGPF